MAKHHLLIIEDNLKIANLVTRLANEEDFEVKVSCDFGEIPSLYDDFKPEAIILDIVMPDMDGFEVLDFLHKRNSSARIVVLSGQAEYRSMVSRMAEGLELAIIATIAKPFRLTEIRQVLKKIKSSLPLPGASSSEAAA